MTTPRSRRRPVAAHPAVPRSSADLLLLQLAGLTEVDDADDSLHAALVHNAKPEETRS